MNNYINLFVTDITNNILNKGLNNTSEKYIIQYVSNVVKLNNLGVDQFHSILTQINTIFGTHYSTTLLEYISDNVMKLLRLVNFDNKSDYEIINIIHDNIHTFINNNLEMIHLYNIPNVNVLSMIGGFELVVLKKFNQEFGKNIQSKN